MRWRTAALIAFLSITLAIGAWVAIPPLIAFLEGSRGELAALAGWSGPVRVDGPQAQTWDAAGLETTVDEFGQGWWDDGFDGGRQWADVGRIRVSGADGTDGRLIFRVGALVPPAAGIVAYGVTLDGDGDGKADWVLGIDNQAPAGHHRTWRTNVATGDTEESFSDEGLLFDSSYPGEPELERLGRDFPTAWLVVDGVLEGAESDTVQFYAWASATEAGNVVDWDYAPDRAWIRIDRPTDPVP